MNFIILGCTNFANDRKKDSSKRYHKIPNIMKFYIIKLRADEYCEVEKLKTLPKFIKKILKVFKLFRQNTDSKYFYNY